MARQQQTFTGVIRARISILEINELQSDFEEAYQILFNQKLFHAQRTRVCVLYF